MAAPAFVADTPRAGTKNHCLILPDRVAVSETEARKVLREVRDILMSTPTDKVVWSSNFAALARKRLQLDGEDREGMEIIAAININHAQLSRDQREHVERALHDSMNDLDDLVSKGIPWNDFATQPPPQRRLELDQWANDRLQTIPEAVDNRSNPPRRQWGLLAVIIASSVAAVAVIGIAVQFGGNSFKNDNQPVPPDGNGGKKIVGKPQPKEEQPPKIDPGLDLLLKATDLKENELFFRIRRFLPHVKNDDQVLKDKKFQEFLAMAKLPSVDLYSFFLLDDDRRLIKEIVAEAKIDSAEKARSLRRKVRQVGEATERARTTAARIAKVPVSQSPFIDLFTWLRGEDLSQLVGGHQMADPTSPIMTPEGDGKVFERLRKLRNRQGNESLLADGRPGTEILTAIQSGNSIEEMSNRLTSEKNRERRALGNDENRNAAFDCVDRFLWDLHDALKEPATMQERPHKK